jgi:hypothetical protein
MREAGTALALIRPPPPPPPPPGGGGGGGGGVFLFRHPVPVLGGIRGVITAGRRARSRRNRTVFITSLSRARETQNRAFNVSRHFPYERERGCHRSRVGGGGKRRAHRSFGGRLVHRTSGREHPPPPQWGINRVRGPRSQRPGIKKSSMKDPDTWRSTAPHTRRIYATNCTFPGPYRPETGQFVCPDHFRGRVGRRVHTGKTAGRATIVSELRTTGVHAWRSNPGKDYTYYYRAGYNI